MQAFQAKHFPGHKIPTQYEAIYSEEDVFEGADDDGLGYYPDGVKRTLTEEQIRIFRHSEVHSLLRQKHLREEALSQSTKGEPMVENEQPDVQPPEKQDSQMTSEVEAKPNRSVSLNHPVESEQKWPESNSAIDASSNSSALDYGSGGADKRPSRLEARPVPADPRQMGRRIISYAD